jgi:hypothetical protein
LTLAVSKRLKKDFSHPLEMTNKNSEPVISNEERDLSELHHYRFFAVAEFYSIVGSAAQPTVPAVWFRL